MVWLYLAGLLGVLITFPLIYDIICRVEELENGK